MPSRRVLASDELLGELKAPAGVGHDQWEPLNARRECLKDLMESTSNRSTPIEPPACTREPPLHGNTFKKKKTEVISVYSIPKFCRH